MQSIYCMFRAFIDLHEKMCHPVITPPPYFIALFRPPPDPMPPLELHAKRCTQDTMSHLVEEETYTTYASRTI